MKLDDTTKYIYSHYWIPESKLENSDDKEAGANYSEWAKQGLLTICEGDCSFDFWYFFKDDFLLGIKENYKHYLIISFILGLFNLFAVTSRFYLVNMEILSYVPMAINFAVIYPIIYCFLFVDEMYSNTMFRNLKLGIKVFIRSLLSTLSICIFFYAGLFMRYIPYYYIKYICIIILIMFIFPILVLASSENEVRVFDKLINPYYFKEYTNKGLYNPKLNKENSFEGKKND